MRSILFSLSLVVAGALTSCQQVDSRRSAWTEPLAESDRRTAEILRDALDTYGQLLEALTRAPGPFSWLYPTTGLCVAAPLACQYFANPTIVPPTLLSDVLIAQHSPLRAHLKNDGPATVQATGTGAFDMRYGDTTYAVRAEALEAELEDGSVGNVTMRVNLGVNPPVVEIQREALEREFARFVSNRDARPDWNRAEAALGLLAHELAHVVTRMPDTASAVSVDAGARCADGRPSLPVQALPAQQAAFPFQRGLCFGPGRDGERLGTRFTQLGNAVAWFAFSWKAIPGNESKPATKLVEVFGGR